MDILSTVFNAALESSFLKEKIRSLEGNEARDSEGRLTQKGWVGSWPKITETIISGFFFSRRKMVGLRLGGRSLSFKTVSILKMRAEDLAVWDFVEFCESIGFSLFFLIR